MTKQKSLADTMADVKCRSGSIPVLSQACNASTAEEVRRWLAICCSGRWVFNISALTDKFLKEARGLSISRASVIQWMTRDPVSAPLYNHLKSGVDIPASSNKVIKEAVAWLEAQEK